MSARQSRSRSTKRRRKASPHANNVVTSADSREVTVPAKQYEELLAANRRLKRKIFDLYTVFEISRSFNAVHDFRSLLDGFVYTCLGQLGAQRGAIFLKPDGGGNDFYLAEAKGSDPLPRSEDFLRGGSEVLTYLSRLNRPVATTELMGKLASADERRVLGFFENGLIVPLIYQTGLSGIFAISEKIADGGFQPSDIEFLSVLSNQVAVAIENARLYGAERMATRQLQQAQQQLVQTERLAALGEMSASVAHEVNNPLGIIKNYLLLIDKAAGDDARIKEHVDVVGTEIDRIAQIVRQLLEFHRPIAQQLVVVDLNRVLDQVLAFMERPLLSDNITVEHHFYPAELLVEGQPQSLKQVFLNLIINARDAMRDGGKLSVATNLENGAASVVFRDTGPGIPAEHIPRIFEPFFTTKHPGEGTGLGLSVCYGIIKQHRGTITYRNVPEGGSFEIRLPSQHDRVERGDAD